MRRIWLQALWFVSITGLLAGCEQKPPEPTTATRAAAPPAPPAPPAPAPAAQAEAEEGEPEEVAAQHVLIAYRGALRASRDVKRSKAEAKKLAEQVLQKAKQGTSFSELAAEYSDCPSKANQGNLGKFKREAMDPKFSEAAFALRVDGVSDVVETKFGFHIIKRNQ